MSLTEYSKQLIQYLFVDKKYLKEFHPDYLKVPKDRKKNLQFRRELIRMCIENNEYAKEIRRICKRDILFYLNVFAWTYNPKNKPSFKVLPFISYDTYQDSTIILMVKSLMEGRDFYCDKSRDMGATWLVIYVFEWLWHFYTMESLLFVSRTEKYVEDKGNPKALFWKFDFHVNLLPMFMKPVIEATDMHRRNVLNGSVIDGESTTGNVARGDRRTGIFLDEFAAVKEGYEVLRSTRDATNCRLFISTPQGANNAFYDAGFLPNINRISLHWTLHPEKTIGLYMFTSSGTLRILDNSYKYPTDYKFTNWGEGKFGSVWYDQQRGRCVSDKEAAQELDINYLGSGDGFFDGEYLKQHYMPLHCVDPWSEGDIVIDDVETLQCHFEKKHGGCLKLWTILDYEGHPEKYDSYGMGADISNGTGASNSVLSIGNTRTGEKVAQWTDNKTSPEKLAAIAVALCRLFNNAFLIWEMNGPGHIFCNKVVDDYGYDNIYYRQNDVSITKKVSDLPGWWNVADAKIVLLGIYRNALAAGKFINHCSSAVIETLQYVYTKTGVEHSSIANRNEDSTESKKHHGDMVIADALLQKLFELFLSDPSKDPENVPENCLLARNNKYLASLKEDTDGW